MTLIASSIGKKLAMALSGLFLVVFLTQHFVINMTSVFSESLFNEISHFMGNNALVQMILQPILIFGVLWNYKIQNPDQLNTKATKGVQMPLGFLEI